MRNLIVIQILLLSLSCFNLLESGLNRIEKKMEDIVNKCKLECEELLESSTEWCNCMDNCLNTKNVHWKITECEPETPTP